MRTTVSISDALLDLAKRKSREEKLTLGQVIEEALRASLAVRIKSPTKSKRPTLITYGGSGLREGVDLSSSASLLDVMET